MSISPLAAILGPLLVLNTSVPLTHFIDDLNGNLVSLTDAKGSVTTYTYDGFDRLIRATYADSTYEDYTYDAASNLVSIDHGQWTIDYSYDALNRLDLKSTRDTLDPLALDVIPVETTDYVYDLGSRLLSASDVDATLTYAYDSLNRVRQVSTQHTANSTQTQVSYTYDKNGNRTSLTYPDGTNLIYAYDPLNRLTAITQSPEPPALSQFTYDALSRRTQLALANGTSTSYTYDSVNRLLSIQHTALSTQQYTYDVLGNRLTQTDAVGTHAYNYDSLSQLTAVDYPTGSAFPDTTFSYDKLGNRTQVVDAGTTSYVPNALNQYAQVGTATLSYDFDGNLTTDGNATYGYDSENRLSFVTRHSSFDTYTYDPFGRRISKTVDGVTTRFLYDGDDLIAETDAAGNITARYVYGTGIDEPIRMDRGGSSYYYHADDLGSIVALTDSAGAVVERYAYDVYGSPRITDATGNPLTQSALGNRFLFTGREYDSETGLYHYRSRAYSPTLGRFLQRDPLGYLPDVNLYRYVGNSPLNWVDPFGLKVEVGQRDIFLGNYHAVIVLTPDDGGQQIWLSANYNFWMATLVAVQSARADAPRRLRDLTPVPDPQGRSDAAFIRDILKVAAQYNNNQLYEPFPDPYIYDGKVVAPNGYNSNSYVAGILHEAGAIIPDLPGLQPGLVKPIPLHALPTNTRR